MVKKPLAAILLALTALAAEAAVDVRIDRPTVAETDSVRVTFAVDRATPPPDFAPLEEDFEILGTYQSNSVNIVNGRTQQEVSWTVDLMPRRTGELTVPPIGFGSETSEARTITVTPAPVGSDAPGEEIFLEIEAVPDQPLVQAQTNLTVRVFRAVPMSSASLTEPNVSVGDAVIERLGDDVAYETTRSGQRFSVVERRYVVFPQQSGRLVIDPLVFEGRIGQRTSFFDTDRGRRVRVRSAPLELDVQPIPPQFTGGAWLPAEDVLLTEDWPGQETEWRAGEPLTRSLTLRARGLTASQLPDIGMQVPDGLRQYPDQPQLETRTVDRFRLASRRETVALIPGRAGEFTLPAIEIPWWNTRTNQPEVARLPARTVRVLPAAGGPAPAAPAAVPSAGPAAAAGSPAEGDVPAAEAVEPAAPGWWPWLSASLALLWLGTLAAWWRSGRRGGGAPVERPKFSATALRRACEAGDPAAAQAELLRWADGQWPGDRIRSPGELAARLDGPLQHEVHRLGRARYGGAAATWDGRALWEAFRGWRRPRAAASSASAPQLEPLYRS